MVTVWWSTLGVIHYRFLESDYSFTGEIYCNQPVDMHGKRSALVNRRGPILLHDNARPHVARITLQKLILGLRDLTTDHLPILLSIPLSPIFRPNKHPPSYNFQKARWDDFAFYFDSHYRSSEEYSSLFSSAALFTSRALNAAKSSIPFGRIKRPPKARWSAEVEDAVSERRKSFAAAHRSDVDR